MQRWCTRAVGAKAADLPVRCTSQARKASSPQARPLAGCSSGSCPSKPPTRSNALRRYDTLQVSKKGVGAVTQIVWSHGPMESTPAGSACTAPCTTSAPPAKAVRTLRSHPEVGRQSSSVMAMSGALTSAAPALRPPAGPWFSATLTMLMRKGVRATIARSTAHVSSVECGVGGGYERGPARGRARVGTTCGAVVLPDSHEAHAQGGAGDGRSQHGPRVVGGAVGDEHHLERVGRQVLRLEVGDQLR